MAHVFPEEGRRKSIKVEVQPIIEKDKHESIIEPHLEYPVNSPDKYITTKDDVNDEVSF